MRKRHVTSDGAAPAILSGYHSYVPLSHLVILAVDDNLQHNYALSRMLEQQGHCEVVRAYSGAEALELATSRKPSAILLDVDLPDVNGWEVCRKMRADPQLADVPIVFITAVFQSTAAKDMARSVGANTLLFYPVQKDQLFAVIQGEIARMHEENRS